MNMVNIKKKKKKITKRTWQRNLHFCNLFGNFKSKKENTGTVMELEL